MFKNEVYVLDLVEIKTSYKKDTTEGQFRGNEVLIHNFELKKKEKSTECYMLKPGE